MNKLQKTIAFVLMSSPIFAQKIDEKSVHEYIQEKDVTRVIKTLTTDEMRGRSAMKPQDIGKATAFLENEFKQIGLQHLKGLTSYRQEFVKGNIEKVSLNLTIDGEKISDDKIIYLSDNEEVSLTESTPIRVIDKEKNFFQMFRSYMQDSTTKLVLVAPEQEKLFKRVQGFYSKSRMLDANSTKIGNTVFVLGKTSATNFSFVGKQKRNTITMTNVVGILEGKSKKNEMVVFSGHYDHIGILPTVEGDSIANGADDDASGTTAVVELARYFKKMKANERTLIFVAFTAEEIGGFGSQYFSKQLNADSVTAMFNIEMIGKASKWGENSAFITGYERSDFGEILQKNLQGTKFEFHPDPYPEQNLFYRSDNATLARLGVPAHSISTDQIDSDKLYHSVKDEFSSLDMKNIVATVQAIALSSRGIIEGKETPKRIDKASVR